MGFYKYLRELWKDNVRDMTVEWRKEKVTTRVERPTRLDKARSLGYRAKQGIIIVRQRVDRGGRQRPTIKGGRKPKRFGRRKTISKNYQQVAEERASKKFKNCDVLNSYYVGQDGQHYWYEIILVDTSHPQIINDPQLKWIIHSKGRAYRGKTSAGRKARGLRHKGKGVEKARPSLRANKRLLR